MRPPAHQADLADVDADAGGVVALHEVGEERPLLLLELAGVGALVEVLGVGGGEVVAADAAAFAGEDEAGEDGQPVVEGDHRPVERIGVVLLAEDDPHVDAGGVHGGRQDGVEPLAHQLGHEVGLRPERQDGRRAPSLRQVAPHRAN